MDILPVLTPEPLEHVEEMDPATRMQGNHWAVRLATLKPRAARRRPGRPRHERLDMLEVVVHGALRGSDGFDALGLALLDHAGDVACYVLGKGEHAAVTDRAVWS